MKRAALFFLAAVLFLLSGCSIAGIGAAPYIYENADSYSAGDASIAQEISWIDVDWIGGEVIVEEYDGDGIVLSETAQKELSAQEIMRWTVDGDTLRIRFAESGMLFEPLGRLEKKLTILLPDSLNPEMLQINSVSADISIPSARAATAVLESVSGCIELGAAEFPEIIITTTSGDMTIGEMQAQSVRISTVSGDAALRYADIDALLRFDSVSGSLSGKLNGSLEQLEVGTVSGDIDLEADDIKRFDIDATSGRIALTLAAAPEKGFADMVSASFSMAIPEDASFKVFFESASGSFESEIPVSGADGLYTAGDGENSYQFSSASGDMKIRIIK